MPGQILKFSKVSFAVALLGLCITFSMVPQAFAQVAPRYEILELIPPGSAPTTTSVANSINNTGQVAIASNGHVWLWEASTNLYTDLGVGTPMQINRFGKIMGNSATGTTIWEKGVPPVAVTAPPVALAFNDNGNIAGFYTRAYQTYRGYFWKAGVFTEIKTFTGTTYGSSRALTMNNLDQVAGIADAQPGHANVFIWQNGKMTNKGRYGFDYAECDAINDRGQMAVSGFRVNTYIYDTVFVDGTTTVKIGKLPGGGDTVPDAMNNVGDIVGTSNGIPFLWTNRKMYNLNNFVTGSGWIVSGVNDINDQGWIVGYGQFNNVTRAFVMRPLP